MADRVLHHAQAIGADTRVTGLEMSVIGTGQVGANVRDALTYDGVGEPGPATVVCKFSSRDPQSAAAGVSTRTYETEVAFYRDLAHSVEISRPHCYFAKLEELVQRRVAPAWTMEPGRLVDGERCLLPRAAGDLVALLGRRQVLHDEHDLGSARRSRGKPKRVRTWQSW